ncbi:hypothetical protein HPB47_004041 [Ixodes persulcatus]|uniref:Uncharacterized protein n=1 Tax=Ixodes persulcatus TaxID=34615 RepID=A0AC60PHX3_IXOPE|nr:hypothetical protein HPB47_004041 [Ixodes persulcatus]
MTGCSVPLCAASSAKGVRCFRFPQEKARRRKWESCVKRDRWKASHTSRICERHFEEDQYEMNRQDGRRLLKRTAVPTLFDFRPQPKQRKPPAPRASPVDRGGATTAGPSSISAAGVSDQEDSGTEDTQANPISEENVLNRRDNTVDIAFRPGKLQSQLEQLEQKLQEQVRANAELLGNLRDLKKQLSEPSNDTGNRQTGDKPVIAVLLFACNRVTVKRPIDQLIQYRPSKEQFPIIVSQDCNHAMTTNVIKAYGNELTLIRQPDQSDIPLVGKEKKFKGYYKIARHYGWALNKTFHDLMYDTVIIVEDDLELSVDFFEYFLALYPILKSDPTLYCVSAWNDNGKAGLVAEDSGGTCESRCLESGVSTDPEPRGFARPRLAVRGFPVSEEKGILVVEPSPGKVWTLRASRPANPFLSLEPHNEGIISITVNVSRADSGPFVTGSWRGFRGQEGPGAGLRSPPTLQCVRLCACVLESMSGGGA